MIHASALVSVWLLRVVRRCPGWVRAWQIWVLPTAARRYVLGAEVVAVGLVAVSAVHETADTADLALMALLTCGFNLYNFLTAGQEMARQRAMWANAGAGKHRLESDVNAVWLFPAALLLPLWMAAVVAVVGSIARQVTVYRPTRVPAYRAVFSATSVVLACAATRGLREPLPVIFGMSGPGPMIALVLVVHILAHSATQFTLLTTAIALNAGTLRAVKFVPALHLLNIAALSLGAIFASLMAAGIPWASLLLIPVVVVLQVANSTSRIEVMASSARPAGVLNSAAWQLAAQRDLQRALGSGQSIGLLIVEVVGVERLGTGNDHADRLLEAVGESIRGAVRHGDLVGRVYDDEFAILAPAVDRHDLGRLAEAVASAVREIDVALEVRGRGELKHQGAVATLGMALSPQDGVGLQDVLIAAEISMRAAVSLGAGSIAAPDSQTSSGLEARRFSRRTS